MSEKVKKKGSFLKRWNFKSVDEPSSPKTPSTPTQESPEVFRSFTPPVLSRRSSSDVKPRKFSAGGIKELVQCSLCLEVLHNPKMLPCQHTFCTACLVVYIADLPIVPCPVCRTRIQVLGPNFIANLPSNLYIDSLLELVTTKNSQEGISEQAAPPPTPSTGVITQSVDLFASGLRCSQCKTICDAPDINACQHCKLNFCAVCWSQHLDDMRTQIASILKQLESAAKRLDYKIEHYKDRCEHMAEQINLAADQKINTILQAKEKLMAEAQALQRDEEITALALQSSLDEAKEVATKAMNDEGKRKDKDMVSTFVNLHQNTVQLLSDVTKWDTERFVFDKENFCIETDAATPLEAESDEPLPEAARQNYPLESEDTLALHYRSRTFVPRYVWRKTARPCGIGIGPWNNHLYVCGMDAHSVLVVERTQAKIVTRLTCDEMLCPVHVAFLKSLGEIYVTDKWKHCVHVFTKDGVYMRSMGGKGSRAGCFRSPEGIATDNAQHHVYVVDTGNDRVQVLTHDGTFVDQIGVVKKQQLQLISGVWEPREVTCTELNAPTAVAVTNDRIVILDSGNRRVKVYNKQDKGKITEFGSLGQRKGQFRQPEVLAVDPMGFILVGDSGNSRVQVFKPNGQLVRVFGGLGADLGKFGWISGIHVTKQLDVIISDTKNHSVNFF